MIGVEVLLCWNYLELGFVFLVEFILLVECIGIIVEFGDWVVEEVCC